LGEEKDAAILMANLKGSKKNKPSNLIAVARACRRLKAKWGLAKMKEMYDISKTQLDWIDAINDLHEDAKKFVRQGKIGMEKGYLLAKLNRDLQAEAAREMIGMNGREARQLIHLLRHKDMSVPEARELVKKVFDKKIHLLVLPLTTENYVKLQKIADSANTNMHDLALSALEDLIDGQ